MRKRFLQILISLRDGESVPERQMSKMLVNRLLAYGAVTCIADSDGLKSYKVISQKDYEDFIYDIGLLPGLLAHDLAEAEETDDIDLF